LSKRKNLSLISEHRKKHFCKISPTAAQTFAQKRENLRAESLIIFFSEFKLSQTIFQPNFKKIKDLQQHSPTKKDIVSFGELDSTIFDRFCTADYDSVLGFFSARQDFEIIGLSSVKNGHYCNI
jgi:hypothetical protein